VLRFCAVKQSAETGPNLGASARVSFPLVPTLSNPHTKLRAAILAGVLLLIGVILVHAFHQPWAKSLIWASLGIGLVFGGKPAVDALLSFKFDIDVLMAVGALLAAYIGHPEEGALLLFLFVLSGSLEALAKERTQREVESLHKLLPTDALVLRNGEWVHADAGSLVAGDRIKVRPGERIPADALVASGETSLDQSAITGESMPRKVTVGDDLFAGTINTDDPIEATITRPVKESSLQKILDMVTAAQEKRQPVQRTIDRLSQPYSLSVMGLSIVVMLVWHLVFKVPLLGDENTKGAVYTAITLLIVASPCALIISTPTATLSAIARAARAGVLFKGGDCIERLARTGAVCLDKTGTLTFGRPRVYEIHPVAWSDGAELLAVAAAMEADSTHPIATAIRDAAAQRSIAPAHLESINHTVARGLEAQWNNRRVRVGSYTFVEELVPTCYRSRVREVLEKIQLRGHIAVVIAAEAPPQNEALGQCAVVIMADTVRPGANTLVASLHALNVQPVIMLTGDNHLTAARVAESLGLDAVHADLLPQDKIFRVTELKASLQARPGGNRGVAVVGDGVNDAPALALADVSLAMGTIGTAAAMDSADIVLLSESLATIPWALRLARAAKVTIRNNLIISLSAMTIMAVLTLVGSRIGHHIPLSVGVLAHEGGTVLVVLNSLWLLRFKGQGA